MSQVFRGEIALGRVVELMTDRPRFPAALLARYAAAAACQARASNMIATTRSTRSLPRWYGR